MAREGCKPKSEGVTDQATEGETKFRDDTMVNSNNARAASQIREGDLDLVVAGQVPPSSHLLRLRLDATGCNEMKWGPDAKGSVVAHRQMVGHGWKWRMDR